MQLDEESPIPGNASGPVDIFNGNVGKTKGKGKNI
jgi:hypothetical protein